MAPLLDAAVGIAADTARYWRAFADFALDRATLERGGSSHLGGDVGGDGALAADATAAAARQLHTYTLVRTFATWGAPHYRAPSFGADMRVNLRNLAPPGTGVSLAWAALNRWVALAFLLVGHPVLALAAAVYEAVVAAASARHTAGAAAAPIGSLLRSSLPALAADVSARYGVLLLDPPHWFALWRLNCALVAEHSRLACPPGSPGADQYGLEEKGRFLVAGDAAGLPVTPFLRTPGLIVKHRAVEGGMGIHGFANFTAGGDWIIQERLQNDAFLSALLPHGAPLSTLRVITASRVWLQRQLRDGDAARLPPLLRAQLDQPDVEVMTTVWRAGRAGAATDHNCICFTVDPATGALGVGVSNQHWYRLGWAGAGSVGPTAGRTWTAHPDTGRPVTGAVIPGLPGVLATVAASHRRLLPEVPLVGWDVALTPAGPMVLEVNLSCNFFCGAYDRARYVAFASAHFVALERLRTGAAALVPPPPAAATTASEVPPVLPALLPLAPAAAEMVEGKPPPSLTGAASAATLCAEAAPAPATARDGDDDGDSDGGGSDDGGGSRCSGGAAAL